MSSGSLKARCETGVELAGLLFRIGGWGRRGSRPGERTRVPLRPGSHKTGCVGSLAEELPALCWMSHLPHLGAPATARRLRVRRVK